MKKMLLPILAVILAVGFSAFTMPKKQVQPKFETLYYWHTDGSSLGSYIGDFTMRNDAVDASDCPDDGELTCARGYRLDQLVDETPGNPPVSISTFADEIKKVE